MFGDDGMGGFAFVMVFVWIVPLAAGLVTILTLWRIMRAQERMVEHLGTIARRLGAP